MMGHISWQNSGNFPINVAYHIPNSHYPSANQQAAHGYNLNNHKLLKLTA
jgi:hypothetical protein